MYLRSLELQGFKSFPDKVKLEFNKGISAVVGPNGSGKSNIGDAMRWVLGEQSSRTLRGGKMEDVIFNGTKNRPRAGFAMATLTIDNEDRALSSESDMVSVTRKLYRNGDSEYMINGANVRLKDIVELFMDTGLGRDGYSIIGQGKIADIVRGKPSDRREIFEEAAGISKFKYKKEEAERKLAAAEDNIFRLTDIMKELESRLAPLEKQCEKAKRFRMLDDEKRRLEISVWVYRLDEYMKTAEGYDEKLTSLEIQYSDHAAELDKLEDKIEDSFALSAEKSALIDQLKAKIHETELADSQAEKNIAVLENDISHIENAIRQLREQIEQSKSSRYFLERELEEKKIGLKKTADELKKLLAEIENSEKSFDSLDLESEEFDKKLADSNNRINGLYIKKSELSYRLEAAKKSLSEAETGLAAAIDDSIDIEGKLKFSESEMKNLRRSAEKNHEAKTEHTNRLSGFEKLLQGRAAKLDGIQKRFSENDIKLRETVQKLGLLQDLERSMDGFFYSVKHIMNASRQGRISGISGTVAQIISVESKYSVAIETALGGALQNIVVENEDVAKRCICLLKENKAGRATFLPITSVKGRRLAEPPENEDGYIALGSELVSCDPRFSGIVDDLLGRICIVEDIDLATLIAKKYEYKFRIVTLDGQVINAGGSFTGGSVSKSAGLLTRKNEIAALEKEKEVLEGEHKQLKADREKLSQETAKLSAEVDGVKEQLDLLSREELRLELEIKRVTQYTEDCRANHESMQSSVESFKQKMADAQKDIDNTCSEINENDKLIAQGESELEASQNKLDSMKERRAELSKQLSELKIKRVEIEKDEESCKAAIEQLESSISDSSGGSGQLEERISAYNEEISQKRSEIQAVKAQTAGSAKVISEINNEISRVRREHSELDLQANRLRSEQKIKMEERENLSNEINRINERKTVCNGEFDKLVSQLWDEYGLTRSEAAAQAEMLDDVSQANTTLAELRNKIKNLGQVNLGAIEEYAEVSERYGFMKSQLDDVNTSRLELEELIGSLTESMRVMFTDCFAKINDNFKVVFTELFGGGRGELVLSDPGNVLDSGIEIMVEPPGKIIKNLLSLSGGEQAFVAICIYFAILKISPSPFCLLDEIEAALDDVNVTRYAQYLHRFTDTTQFITITHRRGTMDEADAIYGVTMQEKGVSKLIKLNLEDTRQMNFE